MFNKTIQALTAAQRDTLRDAHTILEGAWRAADSQPVIIQSPDNSRAQNAAVREDQIALLDYLRLKYAAARVEYAVCIFIDGYGRLLDVCEITKGTDGATMLSAREVARAGLPLAARAVVAVHNHPLGNPEPSEQDIKATSRLAHALAGVEIDLQDHVVIAAGGSRSIRAHSMRLEKQKPDAACWPDIKVAGGAL